MVSFVASPTSVFVHWHLDVDERNHYESLDRCIHWSERAIKMRGCHHHDDNACALEENVREAPAQHTTQTNIRNCRTAEVKSSTFQKRKLAGMATRVLWCALAVALTKPSSALRDAPLPPATLTWMNESASCVFRQTGACDGAFGPREPEGDRCMNLHADSTAHHHARCHTIHGLQGSHSLAGHLSRIPSRQKLMGCINWPAKRCTSA